MREDMSKAGGDKFDLAKLVLALSVFCIHASSLHIYWLPIFRIAVPLFFIMSSYFFFNKYDLEQDVLKKRTIFVKYIKRNLGLYLFWTVVQIVPVIQYRPWWFTHTAPVNVLYILRSVLFGSTFVASWFIMATVVATSLIVLMSKCGNNWLIWTVSVISFIFCCLCSNYRYLSPVIDAAYERYDVFFCVPYNSFAIAFIWIAIGRCFAKKRVGSKVPFLITVAMISTILLFAEWLVVTGNHWQAKSDVYFSLVFLCPAIFALLLKSPTVRIPYAREMRHLSVVIFCTHGTLLYVLKHWFEKYGMAHPAGMATLLTLPCCFAIYFVVCSLAKRYPFFKCAY